MRKEEDRREEKQKKTGRNLFKNGNGEEKSGRKKHFHIGGFTII
ncbi:hypothetical protein [Desulfosarcina sp.]